MSEMLFIIKKCWYILITSIYIYKYNSVAILCLLAGIVDPLNVVLSPFPKNIENLHTIVKYLS